MASGRAVLRRTIVANLAGYSWVEVRKAVAALAVPVAALAVGAIAGQVDVATSVVAIATALAGAVAVFFTDNQGRFGPYAKALSELAVAGGAYIVAVAESGWAWRATGNSRSWPPPRSQS